MDRRKEKDRRKKKRTAFNIVSGAVLIAGGASPARADDLLLRHDGNLRRALGEAARP